MILYDTFRSITENHMSTHLFAGNYVTDGDRTRYDRSTLIFFSAHWTSSLSG